MPSLVTIDLDMLQMTGYAAPDYTFTILFYLQQYISYNKFKKKLK